LATSVYAAVSAHQAELKADRATELFQGSDECRNLREEILKFHDAGISPDRIEGIYRNEPATREFLAANPNHKAFDEYSERCGDMMKRFAS
jgi:hypothetical protein